MFEYNGKKYYTIEEFSEKIDIVINESAKNLERKIMLKRNNLQKEYA